MTGWLRTHRGPMLHWTVTAVLAVLVGVVLLRLLGLAQDSRETEQALDRARERSAERQAALDVLAGDQQELRDQLLELGETPRIPARDLDVLRIEGPEGPRGPRGPRGFRGPAGEDGDLGPPGPAGLDGDRGPAGVSGPAGVDGEDGARGPQGVQGPPGPSGEPGPAGERGSDGQDGAPGPAGPEGQHGPPGEDGEPPVSWTYEDQSGRTFTCTRVDDFDPNAPRYQCTQTSGPGPGASP